MEKDRKAMEIELGLNPSSMLIDPLYKAELDDALQHYWLPQTEANPGQFQWYTNWEIVLKSNNTSIGGIGFLGYPDAAGITETGFMLDQQYHRQGYAVEALQAMMEWAFSHPATISVTARTLPDNLASARLLAKAGFEPEGLTENLLVFRACKNKSDQGMPLLPAASHLSQIKK